MKFALDRDLRIGRYSIVFRLEIFDLWRGREGDLRLGAERQEGLKNPPLLGAALGTWRYLLSFIAFE